MPKNLISLLLLFLNISLTLLPTSCLNQEGLSLLSWLSTFNSSSFYFSSWNSTHQNPCKWAYITCNANGLVSEFKIKSINLPTTFPTQVLSFNSLTTLVVSGTNITGEIPPSIANLSWLTTLDLSYNALYGRIPPEIGKLSELQFISLNSNSLVGEIPREITNCTNLRLVELVDNQLSGKIPDNIGRLSGLEVFRAGGNSAIHGEIPAGISNCDNLIFLGLADTAISGGLPSSLGNLKSLKTISVYTANLSGKIPPSVGNCTSLENLFLYENQISGEIPAELGQLKNLKRILLWQNNLTGNIPAKLGNCTELTVIDLSLNSLSGEIPIFLSNLIMLEELLLSDNNITGKIPPFIGNFSGLKQLELDNNHLSGEIPAELGKLKQLNQLLAWQNQLHGSVPSELGECKELQVLDLSHNLLTGFLPNSLFNLKNLTKLLLISNGFSGKIPPDIGNCAGLVRLRLGFNRFSGQIPSEIGLLTSLSFLELSENQLSGEIPAEIGNCTQLEMLDLHENRIQGMIPRSFEFLSGLNALDLSINRISGSVPEILGALRTLNKLQLNGNYITGLIPKSLGLCKDLQLLDMSSNRLSGMIPNEIGDLQGLDILLNLSWNYMSGSIPERFSNLSKLANLDLSHNMLIGSLSVLGRLENLVSFDVSYNNLSGHLPDTKFFRELPIAFLEGNPELCTSSDECYVQVTNNQDSERTHKRNSTKNVVFCLVFTASVTGVLLILGVILMIRVRKIAADREKGEENVWENWDFTPFQKLNFSIDDILKSLLDSNIIGKGSSGVVYRVETQNGDVIAVKKLWSEKNGEFPVRDSFSAEVRTLGMIRHKNIVRLLGCFSNKSTRLLLFDYIGNGSLAGLLHEKNMFLDWDSRYKIILGAAQGLAYLHHDCIPSIVHRDIKANNILIGLQFEAYLADFGLAKRVDSSDHSKSSNTVAGSYGYIAPEYGYSMRITEKSDVYSFGVVLLEILTGLQPTDHRIPDGNHIINWVRQELHRTGDALEILDERLKSRSDSRIQQMIQVLGMALLCISPSPEERPAMKDIVALLKEIQHETDETTKSDLIGKAFMSNPKGAHCNSFSTSSEPLIRSSPSMYNSDSRRGDIPHESI